jgi:putative RNA 2'-phosphotransferase
MDRNQLVRTSTFLSRHLRHSPERQVHLAQDTAMTRRVGARHGRPVVFAGDAAGLAQAGATFYRPANGIWLVEDVPARYLRLLSEEAAR